MWNYEQSCKWNTIFLVSIQRAPVYYWKSFINSLLLYDYKMQLLFQIAQMETKLSPFLSTENLFYCRSFTKRLTLRYQLLLNTKIHLCFSLIHLLETSAANLWHVITFETTSAALCFMLLLYDIHFYCKGAISHLAILFHIFNCCELFGPSLAQIRFIFKIVFLFGATSVVQRNFQIICLGRTNEPREFK